MYIMNNETLFTEKQKFTQWWIWLIILIPFLFLLFGVYTQVVLGQQFGDKPSGDASLIILTGVVGMLILFFTVLKLETEIKKDGIYVRLFPFHQSFRYYPWDTIEKAYTRTYKPLLEFGGWGIRGWKNNRAFNASGNKGLQLELKENKKLLIGTQKPEQIDQILQRIKGRRN